MPVAKTAAAAAQELDFLAVLGDLAEKLAGLCIKNHSPAGHFYNYILAVLAKRASA